ncbi:DUF397 domain-containing protein [Sphaerisporangium album]|uniref:DUF397 domain-containing protein n=1 Tax=Sphaerisporangium album TaxID=509200 RepID=A0A367FD33_9ACTN|nr:DUF397 domain-containing protein [Sphaerisporangium album]RCG28278.1 DUF397 domain-containing protein [Sphaerisporangium album]
MENLNWRKSSYSGSNGGTCIEVAKAAGGIAVRDSKRPNGGHLEVPVEAFRAFLVGLKEDVV